MKKIFLVSICILGIALAQNYVAAQEVVPCVSDAQRTQLDPKGEPVDSASPATLVTAPVPKNKDAKKIAENVDFDTYMRYLQRRVQLRWYPPNGCSDKKAVVVFNVAKNGRLFDTKILTSSGDETFDKSALAAIEGSAQLLALPAEVQPNFVEMQFNFDSTNLGNNCHCVSYYNIESSNYKNVSNRSSGAEAYSYYQEQVDKVVSLNSPQRQYFFPKKAFVTLGLDKYGNVKYVNLGPSTKCKDYRADVVSALQDSVFPPIPCSLNADSMEFNYNLTSPPYSHANKNVFKCSAAYVASFLNTLVTGH